MKVYSLMNTPAAEGLFHKGIIQSGVIEEGKKEAEDDGTAIVEALLMELKLESVEDLKRFLTISLRKHIIRCHPSCRRKDSTWEESREQIHGMPVIRAE